MNAALDADLMSRAALGDRQAIATLYDRYASTLMGVALRIVGARTDAEDVLHDVFVSLPHRARHYTVERGSVIAWMAILVRNAGIDRIRRYARAAEIREGLETSGSAAPTADPEREAHAAMARERVRQALATLPEAQRLALEAAFFEGLTYAQIAERDGIPLNTVKSRCARAMMALREALAQSGYGVDAPSKA